MGREGGESGSRGREVEKWEGRGRGRVKNNSHIIPYQRLFIHNLR